MSDFDEALRNIDAFCKALVKKIIDEENGENGGFALEPMEKLLYRKCVPSEQKEVDSPAKHLIPVPQLEEPLIDVFEDVDRIRVLMQERCRDHKITIHARDDGIEVCKTECYENSDGFEVCQDRCRRLPLQTASLRIENISAKCNNNAVFEVDIPKK